MEKKSTAPEGFELFFDQGENASSPSENMASFPSGRPDLAVAKLDGKTYFIENEIGDPDFRDALLKAMKQPGFKFEGVSGEKEALAIISKFPNFDYGEPTAAPVVSRDAAPAPQEAPTAPARAEGDMTRKEALDALGNAVREGTGERWIASVMPGSGEVALQHYKGTKRDNVIVGADKVHTFLQDNLDGEGLATALEALAVAALSGQHTAREQAVTAASDDKWIEANSPDELKTALNHAQEVGKSVSVLSRKEGVLYELEMGGSEPTLRVQDVQSGLILPLGEVETKAGDLAVSKKTKGKVNDFITESRGHSEAEPETPSYPLALNDKAKAQVDDVVRSLKMAMSEVPAMRPHEDPMTKPRPSKGGLGIA